jgi:hypothetical protein
LVKIHGEDMPGDVESIGAEGGVTDMHGQDWRNSAVDPIVRCGTCYWWC